MHVLSNAGDVVAHVLWSETGPVESTGCLPQEFALAIVLNGRPLVTLHCTPTLLDRLVVGFLYLEGFLRSVDEVVLMGLCPDDGTAEVWLEDEEQVDPGLPARTSGCGGGFTFVSARPPSPVCSATGVTPDRIQALMRDLLAGARAYHERGGTHSSAISDGERILARAEDVGRHNTVDKVVGECLLSALPLSGGILVTSGRISSEMLLKAARAGLPVVASLTSPTDRAVQLARDLNITVVGYVRGRRMRVYSHPGRVEA